MEKQLQQKQRSARSGAVRFIAVTAVSSALSVILMYTLQFPILPLVPFMRLDFASVPSLLAGFLVNPFAAVVVEVVKILFTLFKTYTAGIGELSNLICSLAFVLPPTILYHRRKTLSAAVWGLTLGVCSEIIISAISGYFFIFPLYFKLMHWTDIGGYSLNQLVFVAIIPFNAIKTVVTAVIVLAVYKPISKAFKRF